MQPYQQDDQGVQQSHDGFRSHTGLEERPVGQRELQVTGDEDLIHGVAIGITPAGHHADGLHRRRVQTHEVVQQSVLMDGQVLDDLLGGIHRVADLDESHDVAGDATRQGHEVLGRPLRQRCVPRQGEQS